MCQNPHLHVKGFKAHLVILAKYHGILSPGILLMQSIQRGKMKFTNEGGGAATTGGQPGPENRVLEN